MAEAELAQRMRLLHDIFGALAPHPAERLSVVALAKLAKFIARAKRILESNRAVLNEFLDSREDLKVVRTESGTTSFPRLLKGRVESLCDLLTEKYDTAVVPGRFFESPQHFRIGMCAEPQLFREGVERLGAALDELA
jgi:aspartate/methionine/tyrosine aminotransferase